jgi:hypothetical protein
MQTTNQIISTLQAMLQAMFKQSKEKNQDCVLTEDMLADFHNLANENPVQNPFFLSDLPSTKEVESLFANIERHASASYTMPYMPISYFKDNIQGKDVYTPAFLPWQTADNKVKNFIINYDNSTAERAAEIYKHMVMSILLGLPPKSVHLSFVNTQLSPLGNFFTAPLDESLYEKVSSTSAFHQLLERLLKHVMDFQDKYGASIEHVNETSGKVVEPYEIVILLDDPDAEISAQEQLIPLFEKGPMYGIYFIGLNSTEKVSKRDDQDNILKHTDCYHVINAGEVNSWKETQKNAFISTGSIANNNVWSKAAFDYLKEFVNRKVVHKFEWQNVVETPYIPTSSEIVAPVGFTEDGTEFNFKMDIVSHPHAFILGQSGSGKSVLLHDIISSIMFKYSPDDVEFYLLDFKLGGVEFNRYKGEKHVHVLLVDNSDIQMTLEILRELLSRMSERGNILRQAGAKDINEYNELNPNKRMKQILFIADECHELFKSDSENFKLNNEISEVITKISKEGRSQGVHLLFATQTLAQAQINNEILNNISDHYLLKCVSTDSDKLVTNSSAKTGKLKTGNVFYHHADYNCIFQSVYADKQQAEKQMRIIVNKSTPYQSNEKFYFSGALQFPISQEVADYIATKGRKNIVASPGQSISLDQTPLTISLKDEFSENITLFGINDRQFVTRTTIGLMTSLMISNKQKDFGYKFLIFDCLGDEEADYLDVLDEMEKNDLCEVVSSRRRIDILKQLCDEIASHRANPTILVILGQERFRELKFNQQIGDAPVQPMDMSKPDPKDFAANLAAINSIGRTPASNISLLGSSVKTVQEAMDYILSEGPANGVHTIIQVDKPNSFLFPQDGSLRKNDFYAKCKHVILLRSEFNALASLFNSDANIPLAVSRFEDEPDRLRAYYYNEEGGRYQLFTPFVLPDKNTINNIII